MNNDPQVASPTSQDSNPSSSQSSTHNTNNKQTPAQILNEFKLQAKKVETIGKLEQLKRRYSLKLHPDKHLEKKVQFEKYFHKLQDETQNFITKLKKKEASRKAKEQKKKPTKARPSVSTTQTAAHNNSPKKHTKAYDKKKGGGKLHFALTMAEAKNIIKKCDSVEEIRELLLAENVSGDIAEVAIKNTRPKISRCLRKCKILVEDILNLHRLFVETVNDWKALEAIPDETIGKLTGIEGCKTKILQTMAKRSASVADLSSTTGIGFISIRRKPLRLLDHNAKRKLDNPVCPQEKRIKTNELQWQTNSSKEIHTTEKQLNSKLKENSKINLSHTKKESEQQQANLRGKLVVDKVDGLV